MEGRICPYCRFPIREVEKAVVCPSCETAHHRDCWEQNGGCARFGCPHSPEMRALNPLVVEVSPPRRAAGTSRGGELLDVCPHCLQAVPARSEVCPWCGRGRRSGPARQWWERSPFATLLAVLLSILISVGLIVAVAFVVRP